MISQIQNLLNPLRAKSTQSLLTACLVFIAPNSAFSAYLDNNDTLTVDDTEYFLLATDYSVTNLVNDGRITAAILKDEATINVNGGYVRSLSLYQNSKANINSGAITSIYATGNSSLSLNGAESLERLWLSGNTQIDLYAMDVSYSNNRLSGSWLDGTDFQFSVFMPSFNAKATFDSYFNVMANQPAAVPLPASFGFYLAGGAVLGFIKRRQTKS